MKPMTMTMTMTAFAFLVVLGAACGFDCRVRGETQHFNDCEALQEGYDALDPATDAAARDDIDTCGEINGCEIQP